jgi:hypothetical protein
MPRKILWTLATKLSYLTGRSRYIFGNGYFALQQFYNKGFTNLPISDSVLIFSAAFFAGSGGTGGIIFVSARALKSGVGY